MEDRQALSALLGGRLPGGLANPREGQTGCPKGQRQRMQVQDPDRMHRTLRLRVHSRAGRFPRQGQGSSADLDHQEAALVEARPYPEGLAQSPGSGFPKGTVCSQPDPNPRFQEQRIGLSITYYGAQKVRVRFVASIRQLSSGADVRGD